MIMKVLRIVGQRTGREVGQIVLADGGTVDTSGEVAARIVKQYRRGGEVTDPEVFAALATGWSNGYLTIAAMPQSSVYVRCLI